MSTTAERSTTATVDQAVERIRDLNDRIIESARRSGEASLNAYERLLKQLAAAEERAGQRSADWLTSFASAQARFTRDLAEAYPAAARTITEGLSELGSQFAEQARRVPGVATAEGEVEGAVAREQDLPIANYDDLNADEVNKRLERLSKVELGRVEAYERKTHGRKTVLEKIETVRRHK